MVSGCSNLAHMECVNRESRDANRRGSICEKAIGERPECCGADIFPGSHAPFQNTKPILFQLNVRIEEGYEFPTPAGIWDYARHRERRARTAALRQCRVPLKDPVSFWEDHSPKW